MPALNLTFQLEVTDEELTQLCDVLECKAVDLEGALTQFGPAAIREYIDMFTGVGPINTATEVRERRLVGLILTRFKAGSPDADQVARLFNITPSAARALLKSVAGKYRLKIAKQIETAIRAVLADAKQVAADKPYTVVIRNRLALDLLNTQLQGSSTPKTPIRANGDSINNFAIDPGSLAYLKNLYP